MANPLNNLTAKGEAFQWGKSRSFVFSTFKDMAAEAPVVALKTYILNTDASIDDSGVTVLSHYLDGQERLIAYFNLPFSARQCNYCITRQELLMALLAVNHF